MADTLSRRLAILLAAIGECTEWVSRGHGGERNGSMIVAASTVSVVAVVAAILAVLLFVGFFPPRTQAQAQSERARA